MPGEQLSVPIFSGEFRHGLDPKNRVTIPSRWRAGEADEFFLMPDRTGSFLRAMPPAQFNAVADQLAANPALTAKDRAVFRRQFFSKAQLAVADKQGRLTLPEAFCAAVNLRGEIVLAGTHDTFELWNAAAWDAAQATEAGTFDRVAEILGL